MQPHQRKCRCKSTRIVVDVNDLYVTNTAYLKLTLSIVRTNLLTQPDPSDLSSKSDALGGRLIPSSSCMQCLSALTPVSLLRSTYSFPVCNLTSTAAQQQITRLYDDEGVQYLQCYKLGSSCYICTSHRPCSDAVCQRQVCSHRHSTVMSHRLILSYSRAVTVSQ